MEAYFDILEERKTKTDDRMRELYFEMEAETKQKMAELYEKHEAKIKRLFVKCSEHVQEKNGEFQKLLQLRIESEENNEILVQVRSPATAQPRKRVHGPPAPQKRAHCRAEEGPRSDDAGLPRRPGQGRRPQELRARQNQLR